MLRLSRPALLLLLAGLSASALAKAPETVNIGYQKANIFALLKYRGTLDESFKKQGIAVRWIEFPAGPQMLEGLNVGSIDLAATGDARCGWDEISQLGPALFGAWCNSPEHGARGMGGASLGAARIAGHLAAIMASEGRLSGPTAIATLSARARHHGPEHKHG